MVKTINFMPLNSPQKTTFQKANINKPTVLTFKANLKTDTVSFNGATSIDKPTDVEQSIKKFDGLTKDIWSDACKIAKSTNKPVTKLHIAKAFFELLKNYDKKPKYIDQFLANQFYEGRRVENEKLPRAIPAEVFLIMENFNFNLYEQKQELLRTLESICKTIDTEIKNTPTGGNTESFEKVLPGVFPTFDYRVTTLEPKPGFINKIKGMFNKAEMVQKQKTITEPSQKVAVSPDVADIIKTADKTAQERANQQGVPNSIVAEDILYELLQVSGPCKDAYNKFTSKTNEIIDFMEKGPIDNNEIETKFGSLSSEAQQVWAKVGDEVRNKHAKNVDQKDFVIGYLQLISDYTEVLNFHEHLQGKYDIDEIFGKEEQKMYTYLSDKFIEKNLPDLLNAIKSSKEAYFKILDEIINITTEIRDENPEYKDDRKDQSIPAPDLLEMFKKATGGKKRKEVSLDNLINNISPELAERTINKLNNYLHELLETSSK